LNKIFINSDSYFLRLSLIEMMKCINEQSNDVGRLAVFALEGAWVSLRHFREIQSCQADRILIIANKRTIGFLSSVLNYKSLSFILLDLSLGCMERTLKKFISGVITQNVYSGRSERALKIFSVKEVFIIHLYLKGYSECAISTLFAISIKRVYAIKKKVMNQVGLESDAGLVNYKYIFYRSPKTSAVRIK